MRLRRGDGVNSGLGAMVCDSLPPSEKPGLVVSNCTPGVAGEGGIEPARGEPKMESLSETGFDTPPSEMGDLEGNALGVLLVASPSETAVVAHAGSSATVSDDKS